MGPDFGEFGKLAKVGIDHKAIEELRKIKTSQWKEMGTAFTAMADFAKAGGITAFMGGTIDAIKSRIENSVTGLFAPIINELTQFVSDLLLKNEGLKAVLEGFLFILSGYIESFERKGMILDNLGKEVDPSQFTWQGLIEAWHDFWDDVLGTATPPDGEVVGELPGLLPPPGEGSKTFPIFDPDAPGLDPKKDF